MGRKTRRGALAASVAAVSAAALAFGGSAAFAAGPSIDDDYIDPDSGYVSSSTGPAIYRFAESDRVLTAIEAAKASRDVWGDVAILASSAEYPDALAAAPLADALDAPVLLNEPGDVLNPYVAQYLHENGFSNVIIASGPGQLGEPIKNQLLAVLNPSSVNHPFSSVTRVAGMNRYETAAALAVGALAFGDYDPNDRYNVFLADGLNFPDALAAGPAAANQDGIVLLSAGATGIPSFTAAFMLGGAVSWNVQTLSWLDPEIVEVSQHLESHAQNIAIGGAATQAAEAGVLGLPTEPIELTNSIVGTDRYDTAVKTATKYVPVGVDRNWFAVASGQTFPDAVVAGAWAANFDGSLLLTDPKSLSSVTEDYLSTHVKSEDGIVVFGGPGSVSPAVSAEIGALFNY